MTQDLAITLCICTFRRLHIIDTLRSVAQMFVKPQWKLHIIVADNDDTPSAEANVAAITRETGLPVTYIHAPARNISIARNACLDNAVTPLVAFIDDDELVTPQWLAAMISTLESSGADVVLGTVNALYAPDCPAWIRKGDFHSTRPVWVGEEIVTGYTCNVLFRKTSLRFRIDLGRSGGEDTEYFSRVHNAGGRIAFAAEAVVTEAVTRERESLVWLLKRRFRSGQTHGMLLLENTTSGFKPRIKNMLAATVKSVFCFSIALVNIMRPVQMRFWLLRGIMHTGVVSRLCGKQEITQYG